MARSAQTTKQLSEGTKHQEQLEQVQGIAADLKQRLQASFADAKRLALLQSVAAGLYDEADKLSKKAPAESASDLMLEQVNDIIRETRELLQEDVYVQRLKEFVPAGNNPQLRDVVVVMRQLRQGMERFNTATNGLQNRAKHLANEAQVIITALELLIQTGAPPTDGHVTELVGQGVLAPLDHNWFAYQSIFGDHVFNLEKLDRTNIIDYFQFE